MTKQVDLKQTSNIERIVALIACMVEINSNLWGLKPFVFSGAEYGVDPWDEVCQIWEKIMILPDLEESEMVRLAKEYFQPTQESYKAFLASKNKPREKSDLELFLAEKASIECLPFDALNPGRKKKRARVGP
ncbi:MAG: hypothetical protein SGARI_001282 [Bacillariaceae sp.]